jgi:hypothetical protein
MLRVPTELGRIRRASITLSPQRSFAGGVFGFATPGNAVPTGSPVLNPIFKASLCKTASPPMTGGGALGYDPPPANESLKRNRSLTIVSSRCMHRATRDSLDMALTGRNAQRGGWQHQADRLAHTHTTVATTAMAAAEQARHRIPPNPVSCHFQTGNAEFRQRLETSITEAHEPHSLRTKPAEREQQVARETAAAWLLNGRRETLAARAARVSSAEKRAIELEDELALARERHVLQENENHSLQMSLDLTTSENAYLSNQLAECERQIQKLEQLYSKLVDDTHTLLKTCRWRDAALARAEDRLGLLADLFVQLEAASVPKSQKTIEELNSQLRRELDKDKWLLVETDTFIKKAV